MRGAAAAARAGGGWLRGRGVVAGAGGAGGAGGRAGLDRRGEWRALPEAELRGRAGAQLLALREGQALLKRGAGAGALALATLPLATVEALPKGSGLAGPLLLLGAAPRGADGCAADDRAGEGSPAAPLFAAEVGPEFEPDCGAGAGAEAGTFEWHSARSAFADLGMLSAAEVEALALGNGLNEWHRRSRFCARCGGAMAPAAHGHQVVCSVCDSADYPRVDPCAIVLVHCGEWALLGRKAAWPAGRYSTLAGFTEMAESIEASALREVFEESGVRGDPEGLRFTRTQTWPFPRSLMVAFEAAAPAAAPDAEAEAEANALDAEGVPAGAREPGLQPPVACEEELEDVRWFHRSWLNSAMDGGGASTSSAACEVRPGVPFRFPGPGAVSRELMDGWRAEAPPASPLDALADAVLCPGRQKYVLVLAEDPATGVAKLVVRGLANAAYHMDVFQHFFGGDAQLDLPTGLRTRAVGGGRIEYDPGAGRARIFGFSYAYGRAPHSASAKVLRKRFPFLDVETSEEGY